MKFGEKLSFLRKQQGMTQQELAEKLDVSRQAVSRWERMTSDPSTENLISTGKLFEIPVDSLINDGIQLQKGGCLQAELAEKQNHRKWRDKLKQQLSIFNRRIYLAAAIMIFCYDLWIIIIYNSPSRPSALVSALTGFYANRVIGPLFSFFFVLYLILSLFDRTEKLKKHKTLIQLLSAIGITLVWMLLCHSIRKYGGFLLDRSYFAVFSLIAALGLKILQKRKEKA